MKQSVVLEALLAEAAAANPAGHLYTRILRSQALRRAAAPEAGLTPLRGVPLVVKDNIDVAGVETSCGRRSPAPPAAASAAIVSRLEALGAVVIAKTNLDEAALGASGRNAHFGRCVNPRDPTRLSGGSSSGSAAAVAAGHSGLGLGTDTLGSVRIPAAFCGVAGFKPSHGRLSTDGVAPLYPRFDTLGLIARSLAELWSAASLLFDAGPPVPELPPCGITLAVLDEAALRNVEPAIAQAYRRCLEILRDEAGCRTVTADAIDWAATAHAALWEVAHEFAVHGTRLDPGYRAIDDIGDDLGHLLRRALERPAARLADGRKLLTATAALLRTQVGRAALLTPTCPHSAPAADAELPRQVADFVAAVNVAGLPAVTWPQAMGAGRTVSLQLIGRFGKDVDVLRLAASLQRSLDRGCGDGRPPAL